MIFQTKIFIMRSLIGFFSVGLSPFLAVEEVSSVSGIERQSAPALVKEKEETFPHSPKSPFPPGTPEIPKPQESVQDPPVIPPPITDPEMAVPPPVTDPEMVVPPPVTEPELLVPLEQNRSNHEEDSPGMGP